MSSVVLTDVVPAGLAYVEGSATGSADGELVFAGYDATTRTLSWTAATLTTSGSVSYRVTVLADAACEPAIRNTARISSPETDRPMRPLTSLSPLPRPVRRSSHPPKPSLGHSRH